MKPAVSFKKHQYPNSWQEMPNGDIILEEINQVMAGYCSKFFGYYLLKIGGLSAEVNCEKSPIKHHVTLANTDKNASVISTIDDLPFLEHSIDACLISHTLEFTTDPHHLIREANRVLIPDGDLVITGFNPFSLAGINRLFPFRRKVFPWGERFFSAYRVKDWLHLMGYEILTTEYRLYSSLSGNINQGFISTAIKAVLKKYLPQLGSVYIIIAKKRELPLTPIKPKWKINPKFTPVNVTGMSSNQKPSSRKTP